MIKPNITVILMLFLSSCLTAQIEIKSMKVLGLNETTTIKENSIDYLSSINIADSLYKLYNDTTFFIENDNFKSVESGLTYILRLYKNAAKFADDKKYCDEQILKIHFQIEEEIRKGENKEYNKIIIKAEEYYSNGNIEKSIELFERAIKLNPTDESVRIRLLEINKIKSLGE
jgi:tetratricopeptide (TPR) repeat protein